MTIFEISQSREKLTTHSGLALVGRLLNQTRISDLANQMVSPSQKGDPKISHAEILVSYMGLLAQGKNDFEAIEEFREDEFFKLSLDLERVPSSSRLRQRLDELALLTGHQDLKRQLKEESARLLKARQVNLTPTLGQLVALDLDVSPFNNSGSQKEGVGRTYKGFDGYSPIFAYLGLEGYQINAELRPGKQHCQNGTPVFLRETLHLVRLATDLPLLVRMDSGNDAKDNLFILEEAKHIDYIIKRNLRRESKIEWLKKAQAFGIEEEVRKGKTIYYGYERRTRSRKVENKKIEYELTCLFKVTRRTFDRQGHPLKEEEIEVESYWTSLPLPVDKTIPQALTNESRSSNIHKNNESDLLQEKQDPSMTEEKAPEKTLSKKEKKKLKENIQEVIEQYHAHGTSEQYHSEIKTDMDLERFPSGHFLTNHLILVMGLLIYNLLRIIGQTANFSPNMPMRKSNNRRRLSTVIKNLITIASRLVYHARRFKLRFGAHAPWFHTFKYVYQRLAPI